VGINIANTEDSASQNQKFKHNRLQLFALTANIALPSVNSSTLPSRFASVSEAMPLQ